MVLTEHWYFGVWSQALKALHHLCLFKVPWIKAFSNWHTILKKKAQIKPIFLTKVRKNSLYSLYSDSHLQLIITIWNHRLGRMRRAVPLPALSPQTIKLLRQASCYILCAASVCVLNTWICNQHILHILPLRCPANIKGGKGWFGISVCLCLPMYKTARLSAPRHRRGAAEEI